MGTVIRRRYKQELEPWGRLPVGAEATPHCQKPLRGRRKERSLSFSLPLAFWSFAGTSHCEPSWKQVGNGAWEKKFSTTHSRIGTGQRMDYLAVRQVTCTALTAFPVMSVSSERMQPEFILSYRCCFTVSKRSETVLKNFYFGAFIL